MNKTIGFQGSEDLAFFGKINASISHELKNIFAIISETAGLLNDMTALAEKGKKVDMGMFRTCSRDIEEEIQRGFSTVKYMNNFSHSVDTVVKSVSLMEVLHLMTGIAGFLSYAGRVRIDAEKDTTAMVLTCPFRLQQLIYHAIVFAFKTKGPAGEIQVSVRTSKKKGGFRITFSGLGELGDGIFPVEKMAPIAESIDAEISLSDDFQAFDILVPEAVRMQK